MRLPERTSGVFAVAPLHKPFSTLAGLTGNWNMLSLHDKASLANFVNAGLAMYFLLPERLDRISTLDFANKWRVGKKAIQNILIPFTAGIFFLPPERYSAFNFFGLFGAHLNRLHKSRLGAFMGGMTEVMTGPIASAVERKGGIIKLGTRVDRLLLSLGSIVGVSSKDKRYLADHVVLATPLSVAKQILSEAALGDPWFNPMMKLSSMPAVTIQFELKTPALPFDRTTFSPGTVFASYAEQSRTTFRHAPGRLSVILTPPEKFIEMESDRILSVVLNDADRLALNLRENLTAYRVIRFSSDFYSLAPGNESLRPAQKTPISGLTLAGDYTRQPYLATMEGAVVSGKLAADIVRTDLE